MMNYADGNRVPCYFLMWFDFFNHWQWQTCVLLVHPVFHVFYTEIVTAVMSNMFSRNATITFKSRWVDWAFKAVAFSLLLDDYMFLPNESFYEYAWAYKHNFLKEIFVFWKKNYIGSIFQLFFFPGEKTLSIALRNSLNNMYTHTHTHIFFPFMLCFNAISDFIFSILLFIWFLKFTVSSLPFKQLKWQWLVLNLGVGRSVTREKPEH